ncbi:MAG: glycosyl transferase, partial [Bacteroidota bacterium]
MKVLIIRFSSIGDIVLTTPVVRCLHQQRGATVHFLTKQSFASLLSANPYVDKLWTIKKEIKEVLPGLLAESYDHIIDLHVNLRTLELKTRLLSYATLHLRPRPKWHAFDKLNLEKYLLVNFKIN